MVALQATSAKGSQADYLHIYAPSVFSPKVKR